MKRIASVAAMAVLSMAAPSPASAQGIQYLPTLDFYSDASFTQIIGHAQPICRTDMQMTVLVWGQSSQYQIQTDTRPCGPGYYDDQ